MATDRIVFGKNVKKARVAANLSQQKLADLLLISKNTIVNVEIGAGFVREPILKQLRMFFGFSRKAMENEDFKVHEDFRRVLAKRYKGKQQYIVLQNPPEIKFAIEKYLMSSNVLDKPVEKAKIVKYFQSLGWSYDPGSIYNALMTLPDLIKWEWSSEKKNTKLFSRKL